MSESGRPYLTQPYRPLPPGASPDGTGESVWHHEKNLRSNAGTPGKASPMGELILLAWTWPLLVGAAMIGDRR